MVKVVTLRNTDVANMSDVQFVMMDTCVKRYENVGKDVKVMHQKQMVH